MASPLTLHPEASSAASRPFADSLGGPILVMSASALGRWNGVCDPQGNVVFGAAPCDYDRACAAEAMALVDVGDTQALVLDTPDLSTFVPRADGVLIVRWIGADDAATLISAALWQDDAAYQLLPHELPHDGGHLWMFDSGRVGATVATGGPGVTSIELPAGRYAVELLTEWSGDVLGDDGHPHAVMVQVLRLRRVQEQGIAAPRPFGPNAG